MASTRSTLQTSKTEGSQARRIIFFDGHCNLCNRWVDFLLQILRSRTKESTHYSFQMASLQGKTAQEIMQVTKRADLLSPPFNTVVLYERVAGTVNEVEFFTESDAILRVLVNLGFPWSLFGIFRILPRGIRDGIYRWVSRNRYHWFGKRDVCRLPSNEEKVWLLD